MRGIFTALVSLSVASSSLAASPPLEHRASNQFISCLEKAGLDPVVSGESSYQNDIAPFNLRYVPCSWLRATIA